MKNSSPRHTSISPAVAALAFIAAGALAMPALAQVAGETTRVDTTITETNRLAMGWSVKKSLMGKNIYNDLNQKVGEVEDLIISPDRNVSYVIVGAGGFLGMGSHDVAIAVSQIQNKAGKLVLPGATKETVKAMPTFSYASVNPQRDKFLAAADSDIAKGKAKVADLGRDAVAATPELKAGITQRMTRLELDVKAAEARLQEMKQGDAGRWRSYEAGVNAATDRLRKSIDTAAG